MFRFQRSAEAYMDTLRKKGYMTIGRGAHAVVFVKDWKTSSRVIKVSSWDGFPDYMLWAKSEGYEGTFAPKVHSFKSYGGFYVAVVERLVCTISEITQRNYRDGRYYSMLQESVWNPYPYNDTEACEFNEFSAKLKAAGLNNDCHPANVMLRADGQVVIADPISLWKEPMTIRLKSETSFKHDEVRVWGSDHNRSDHYRQLYYDAQIRALLPRQDVA